MSSTSISRMVEARQYFRKIVLEGGEQGEVEHAQHNVKECDEMIAAHEQELRERLCLALIASPGAYSHEIVDRAKEIEAYIVGEEKKAEKAKQPDEILSEIVALVESNLGVKVDHKSYRPSGGDMTSFDPHGDHGYFTVSFKP